MSVSRDDLEAKLREIEGAVSESEEEARQDMAIIIGGAVAVAVVLVVFGIWRSRRRRIHIEVYHTL